jgi:hypothetical protein
MCRADLFVLLDHVQFERQNYQNRVLIKTGQGPCWLVVPVYRGSRTDAIVDKRIDNQARGRHRWGRRLYLTLEHAYRGAPGFGRIAPDLRSVLDQPWERLVDLNFALLGLLRGWLGVTTPLVRSSDLDVRGRKSELVASVCEAVGARVFLGGQGASRRYLDLDLMRRRGIGVAWHEFSHPRYPQHPRPRTFTPGLSAVDLLANQPGREPFSLSSVVDGYGAASCGKSPHGDEAAASPSASTPSSSKLQLSLRKPDPSGGAEDGTGATDPRHTS